MSIFIRDFARELLYMLAAFSGAWVVGDAWVAKTCVGAWVRGVLGY